MGDYLYSNTFLVIAVLVFVAVLLLAEGLYLVWRGYGSARARKIERRLQELNDLATAVKARNILKRSLLSELPLLQRTLIQSQRARRMHDFLRQAGLDWTVSRLLLLSGAATAIGFYLAMVPARQSMTVGLGLAAAAACLPLLFVQWKRARRMWKLGRQLPDAVDMIVRALRAGHAFSSGLQMAGDQMAEPIAGELRIVHDEVTFGVSLQQALINLGERVPLTDMRYFIVSVLIQRESGGNLTEVLDKLSKLIRERLKLFARIRILSSEGRLSAWILGIMPFGLAAVIHFFNPVFMSLLWTDPLGVAITKTMLGVMVVGVVLIRRIVRIRV